MNKNDAFKSFGVNQRCQRRSWSGRNDQLVVLTIWTDQKEFCKREKVYKSKNTNAYINNWKNKFGNIWRKEDISYCIKNNGGLFRAIFLEPKEKNVFGSTRVCKRAKPMTSLWFKITDFDIETGAWSWISLNAEVSEKD